MIKEKILKILNKQINEELFSSYLYLSMSNYFTSLNLDGFAKWMRIQSKEEYEHALKIYDYILERNARVVLTKIETPKAIWKSPLEAFQETLKHEQHITACINNIVNDAIQEKDHPTTIFFQWFVSEQVEEEANAANILEKVKMVGDSKGGLYMLDRELGKRQ